MELAKEQIEYIEKYLTYKQVDYLDLKIEILDHIISDIEQLINQKYSFELAFSKVQKKWNRYFKENSSFYFGLQYTTPKIVLKKAIKEFRRFYFIYMISYFLPFIFLTKLHIQFPQKALFFVNSMLKTIIFLALLSMSFMMYKTIKSKVKTTYSFILKTQRLGIIFLIIPLFIHSYFNKEGVFFGFSMAGLVVAYICYYFYKKHLLEIEKNKKLI